MENSSERPSLDRSSSFDHSFWQRPPSAFSIKVNRESIRRQNTFPGTSVDDIPETETSVTTDTIITDSERTSTAYDPDENTNETQTLNLDEHSIGVDDSVGSEGIDISCHSPMLETTRSDHLQEPEISEIGGCIECVKAIPVFSGEEIDEGDHIVFAGAVYDHHGIVVSKLPSGNQFEIIEATNTVSGVVVGLSKFFGGKAKIDRSVKEFNFSVQNIRVVEYRNRKFSKQETVQRAREYLDHEKNEKNKNKSFKYHLFDNNCEHFATYCVTGNRFSIQVTKFRLTVKLFFKRGFFGISNEMIRNEKEYENKIICRKCYEINKGLLSVNVKPIRKADDVNKGDIIRYTYYNLWHEAVVLEIKEVKDSYLKCDVAHYAFCGFTKHRTIISEELKIDFDGKRCMLEYAPKYKVYDPETVVQRARRRLGEQQFVFFSNDSSHFARWCKLKLKK